MIYQEPYYYFNPKPPTKLLHRYKKATQTGEKKLCTSCKRIIEKNKFYLVKKKTGFFCRSLCKECEIFNVLKRNKRNKRLNDS